MNFTTELEQLGYFCLQPPTPPDDEGIEKPVTFVKRRTFQELASIYRSRANLHALQLIDSNQTLLLANVHLQGWEEPVSLL